MYYSKKPVHASQSGNITTWEETIAIPGSYQAAAFSPDGRWLAANQSWDIQIWDVAELMELGVEHNNETSD